MTISVRVLFVVSVIASAIACAPGGARAVQERCETSKAGIKRCESDVGGMKSALYTDRAHSITNWELSIPRKVDAVWPTVLIGATMQILVPNSTTEERSAMFRRLVDGAAQDKFQFIPFGNYEWIASRAGTAIIIRASRKPK
jgi:hypothetical protein